jgi:hypothetical protein
MRILRHAFVLVLAMAVPASAAAQYAASFDELPAATKKGQKLFVFDDEGNEVRGRLAGVTADTVTLVVDKGRTRELARDRITLIRTPSQDSVLNGAAIGASATGIVALISFGECVGCSGAGSLLVEALLWGGGIGALVDAFILTPRDVYRVGKRRVDVNPIVSRDGGGARVRIAW